MEKLKKDSKLAQDAYQIEINSLKQKCDHMNKLLNKPKFTQEIQTDNEVFEDKIEYKFEFPKSQFVFDDFKPQKKLKVLELKSSSTAEIK